MFFVIIYLEVFPLYCGKTYALLFLACIILFSAYTNAVHLTQTLLCCIYLRILLLTQRDWINRLSF